MYNYEVGFKLLLLLSTTIYPNPANLGFPNVDPLGVCDSTKAKAFTLLMGIHELKYMGLTGSFVEGNSLAIVRWR